MSNQVTPELIPAELVARPSWIQCGLCGCNKEVEFYVMTDEPGDAFDAVCDCPLPAVLTA